MVLRRFIPGIIILLNTVFSYGQVQLEPACFHTIEKYGVTGYLGSDFVWTIIGGTIISGDGTDTVTVRWDEPTGITGTGHLSVTEYTSEVCFTKVPSEAIIKIRGPHVELGPYEQETCIGDTTILDLGSSFLEPYSITWQDNSHNQMYFAHTSEKIKVSVIDSAGCMDADSINFVINNLPVVNLGGDTVLCNYDNPKMIYYSQIMSNPSSFNHANWYFRGEESTNDYVEIEPVEKVDTLSVRITNNKGCSQSDTILILPCDVTQIFANIPNTITPDGNGVNDVWNISPVLSSEIFAKAVLEIFDRWGRLVYHTEHVFEEPWDGKSKGRLLPMDSYYYVLKLNYGDFKPLVGTVNLIK